MKNAVIKTVTPTNKNILTIKYIPLSTLSELSNILFQGNPKKHDIELLQLSIAENGFIDPPKWDDNLNEGRGGIVYGNGRLEALVYLLQERQRNNQPPPDGVGIEKSGEWCIPVKFGVNAASEMAAKKLAIDHNNLTNSFLDAEQQALSYDEELYKSLLNELGTEHKPITVDEEFLEQILSGFGEQQGGGEEEEGTELDVNVVIPRCKPGEIWRLGRHKIFVGSCLDEEAIASLLGGEKPGFIWSDPPYGMKCQGKDGKVGGGKLFKGKPWPPKKYPIIAGDETAEVAASSFSMHFTLHPKAQHIWWGANHYSLSAQLPNSTCWIVWDKMNGGSKFADCEIAWTNAKMAVRKFNFLWSGMMKEGEAANQKQIHPNQKPVELVNWAWDLLCEDALLCFDPFLGSGTSIMAAEKHGERTVYGCEIMPGYAEVTISRWEGATGKVAELEAAN